MYSNVVCIGDSYTNEEEMYKRLISEIGKNKEVKKKFDKLKIKSYELEISSSAKSIKLWELTGLRSLIRSEN